MADRAREAYGALGGVVTGLGIAVVFSDLGVAAGVAIIIVGLYMLMGAIFRWPLPWLRRPDEASEEPVVAARPSATISGGVWQVDNTLFVDSTAHDLSRDADVVARDATLRHRPGGVGEGGTEDGEEEEAEEGQDGAGGG